MTKNKKIKTYIIDTLSLNPDQPHIGRDISTQIQQTYNQSASPKKMAKIITQLQPDYPQIQKTQHTPQQSAQYGCRYTYTWDTTSTYQITISATINITTQ